MKRLAWTVSLAAAGIFLTMRSAPIHAAWIFWGGGLRGSHRARLRHDFQQGSESSVSDLLVFHLWSFRLHIRAGGTCHDHAPLHSIGWRNRNWRNSRRFALLVWP